MSSKLDIDTYLNPLLPASPVHHLPRPISHFLGYRPPNSNPRKAPLPIIWLFCFIGAFCGVALIEAVYLHLPLLSGHQVPVIIASFGAAAILEYNTIESPLAQPRNLVFGHFISAVIGVGITKLFGLLPHARFEQLRWLAGALAVGVASVAMSMTKTVHPPAGATALITATSPEITELGWWTLALILLGCMLMLVSALILNNIVRQFPMYWWTPADLRKKKADDIEKVPSKESTSTAVSEDGPPKLDTVPAKPDSDASSDTVRQSGDEMTTKQKEELIVGVQFAKEVHVTTKQVWVPESLSLSDFEKNVLQMIQERLIEGQQ